MIVWVCIANTMDEKIIKGGFMPSNFNSKVVTQGPNRAMLRDSHYTFGTLAKYARLVSNANLSAVTDQ